MKRLTTPPAPALALNVSSTTDLAEIMHRMNLNALMRGNGCAVLDDAQLADWLDGANITAHPDDFGAFEVLFGFDAHSQDFVVIKSTAPNGPHFALIAPITSN